MPGLYFEEFTVGQVIEHSIRRTITETDNVLITTMTHNPASLHLDAEYMKQTEFGKTIGQQLPYAGIHGWNFGERYDAWHDRR